MESNVSVQTHRPSKPADCRESGGRGVRFSCSTDRLAVGVDRGDRKNRPSASRNSPEKSALGLSASRLSRLREKLDRYTVPEPNTGCHLWLGGTIRGYGQVRVPGNGLAMAHRMAFELERGSIPPGMQLDHLCREPSCLNPAHLEPVTPLENVRRGLKVALKRTCPNGHPWVPENLYPARRTCGQKCKICHAANESRRIARRNSARRAKRAKSRSPSSETGGER